ncbi:hypothetical protein RhiirA4_531072 [Rhizophagus irregularis]|uniref:Uncharacterized protein n=1 Tax=Rhizophagus irregularis TaxID=588596 RepID=A0A2I1GVR1_9GLOM|nr:hypothetical protein RhiirA4_531072 [Rhizophagus irregularis]
MVKLLPLTTLYLEDYNDIKKSLQNKQGRIPRWYNFLKDKLTLCSNNRLTIKLENPIIKNPRIERLRSPSTINEPVTYKGPRKWFLTWSNSNRDVVYEKAILSIHPSHLVPTLYAEHWIHVPDTQSQLTPRSRSNILQPCSGCNLHFPYFVGDCQAKCILKLLHSTIIRFHALTFRNTQRNSNSTHTSLHKKAVITKKNHEHYRILAYNDYLARKNILPLSSNISTDLQTLIMKYIPMAHLRALQVRTNFQWDMDADLKKIRAHSDNPYNDRADVLAKEGRLLAFPTSINHDHIPSQTVTISWDNTIPLDTNIRKCVGKIIDYKRIDNHLNHQGLTDILDFTKNHVINWELSSRFFNHNNYNDSPTRKTPVEKLKRQLILYLH